MIAPTTLAVALTFRAVKTYGSDAGTRSFQSTFQGLAAYERRSSCARGSADWSPRSVLIATGKKVRYAAITATDCQPAFSQTTTIGATARIGIVCDATMYGSSARCASRECTSPTASANPTTAPIAKPASASFAVNQAASRSTVIRSGPWERDGSPSALKIVQRWGSVVLLTGNGHVQPVSTQTQR